MCCFPSRAADEPQMVQKTEGEGSRQSINLTVASTLRLISPICSVQRGRIYENEPHTTVISELPLRDESLSEHNVLK